jgi:hypothetical protein
LIFFALTAPSFLSGRSGNNHITAPMSRNQDQKTGLEN